MRKRIVIGVLVVATVIAVVALANRPGENSIEYHKTGYIVARDGRVWTERLRNVCRGMVGEAPRWQTDMERMNRHERALIKLGYLEERTVVVSNRHAPAIILVLPHPLPFPSDPEMQTRIRAEGRNKLVIVGLRDDMPKWEKLVRDADVP